MLIYESNSMVLCSRRSSSLGWNRKHDFMASDSSRRSIKNTSPCCVRLSSRIKVIINFTSRDIFIQSCARSSFKDFLAATANKNHLSLLIESAPDHWLSHYKPPPTAVQRRNRQWIIASTAKRKKTRQESFITSIAWFILDPGSPAPIVVSAIIRKCQIRTRKAELRTASPTFSIKIARIYLDQN